VKIDDIDRLRERLRERYKNNPILLNRFYFEFEQMIEERLRTYLEYGSPEELREK
jgi:hypothetical protein